MAHKRAAKFAAVLFWLLFWQIGASLANRNLLLPVPTVWGTILAFVRMAGTGAFWSSLLLSLLRIAAGFSLAFLFGTLCALLSERCSWFKVLTEPLLQIIRAVPVAAFIILLFLWISREKIPVVISFLTVLPIVWADVEKGLEAQSRELTEMAKIFGMPQKQILWKIQFPSLRSYFSAAAVNGLGFAWKSAVAAEIICRTSNSLGNLLWASKSALDYEEVFAVALSIAILSMLLQCLAEKVLRGKVHD